MNKFILALSLLLFACTPKPAVPVVVGTIGVTKMELFDVPCESKENIAFAKKQGANENSLKLLKQGKGEYNGTPLNFCFVPQLPNWKEKKGAIIVVDAANEFAGPVDLEDLEVTLQEKNKV
jgi:hypothetical protein